MSKPSEFLSAKQKDGSIHCAAEIYLYTWQWLSERGCATIISPQLIERFPKLPVPRQMLCTDIRVPVEEVDRAFIRAWNFLVSHGLRYAASYREMARDGKDELIRYRAMEMAKLLDRGRIREFDYRLMLKVLDHIEVTPVGKLAVIFLTGTRVTV